MALAILTAEKLESTEANNESSNFLSSTIRSLFKRESEIDKHLTEIEYNNSLKQYTLDEVRLHDSWGDCWIIIYDRVYDITQFLHQVSEKSYFFNHFWTSLKYFKRSKGFSNLHS